MITWLPPEMVKPYRAPLRDRTRVFLVNLWNWRTAWACRYMRKQIQKDPEFWRTYHANIACITADSLRAEFFGLTQQQAMESGNRCADRLMRHLFDAPPTPERLHP